MSGWSFRPVSSKWTSVQGVNKHRSTLLQGPRELGHKLIESFIGKVVSTKMQKTCAVEVSSFHMHPKIRKFVKRSKRFLTHDPLEEANYGDVVEIRTCRPISRTKHHFLHRIIKHRPEIKFDEPPPEPLTYRQLMKEQQGAKTIKDVDVTKPPEQQLSYESISTPLPFIRKRGREADELAERKLNDLESQSFYRQWDENALERKRQENEEKKKVYIKLPKEAMGLGKKKQR